MTLSDFIRRTFTPLFETPDPGSGAGGAGTAVAPQPGTPGQGQGGQGDDSGFWNLFPDVPEEHRPLLQPHLRNMQGHITQLEQQVASLQPVFQAGYTPETIQGLVNFDQKFSRNPVEEWLNIGKMLQQATNGGNPALDPEIDLEHLAALARGEDPDANQPPAGGQPPQAGGPQMQGLPPEVQQYVQGLEATIGQLGAQVQELQQGFQQDRAQRTQTVQDRAFEIRIGQMRDALKKSGWPEELLTDQALTAEVLVHRGNFGQAAKALIDRRTALLKSATARPEPEPAEMPHGAPPSPSRRETPGTKPGDPWAGARKSAESRLARANRPQ